MTLDYSLCNETTLKNGCTLGLPAERHGATPPGDEEPHETNRCDNVNIDVRLASPHHSRDHCSMLQLRPRNEVLK